MWDKIKRPTYEFSDGRIITFRSNWELNYSLYLEWLKLNDKILSWEYEPERYDFIAYEGKHPYVVGPGYLPDFQVINNDGTFYLVELKGRAQGMLKLKRMKKYYPKIKIELVTAKEYKELKNKVGKICHFYD